MFVGTLEITSTPPGATVRIDNEAVGTTPLTLSRVRAGTRTVRIEHEGFARWSRAVLVPADQRARVKAVLDPVHMGPEGEKQ
jgi:hypothetical protein